MSALVIFLIEQVLPWVLTNLPAILKFLMDNYPQAHAMIVANVKDSVAGKQQMKTGQGLDFDWHSGP